MSHYQETYKSIRDRVRAGERKRDIFNDYANEGKKEAWLAARILCQVATNRNRHRYLWAHVTLLVVFSLYVLIDLVGLFVYYLLQYPLEQIICGIISVLVVLTMTICLSAKWNPMGYLMADAFACFRLYHFLGAPSLSPAATVQCVLLGMTLLMGIVLQGGLFPCTSFFLWPKRDSLGVPKFED